MKLKIETTSLLFARIGNIWQIKGPESNVSKLAGMIYFEVGLLQLTGGIESQESHRMDKEDETSVLKELAHISHCTSWKDFSRAPILRFMQTSRFPIKFE